jgi:segregation and condensation protein A
MRRVASRLMGRDRLERDVFARGAPEGIRVIRRPKYEANLFELLKAYGAQRALKVAEERYEIKKRHVWAIEAARARLEAVLGKIPDWIRLEAFLPETAPEGEDRRTYIASAFSAALELAKEGQAELRQEALFTPIYLRPRRASEA